MKRELALRTPSKRQPLQQRDDFPAEAEINAPPLDFLGSQQLTRRMEMLRMNGERDTSRGNGLLPGPIISSSQKGSPIKVRKLVAKKWLADDHDDADL